MIDSDDADFALLASMGTGGWLSLILLAAGIIFMIIASQNEDECEKRSCDRGKPALVDGECVCQERAR